MDSEEIRIDSKATTIINQAKSEKRKICAVGTTVMRTLESAVSSNQRLNEYTGWTNKFIFPPYDFSIANCMVTNFHMPKSTLLMMISAFTGHDLMEKAYKEAIKEKYKFYSYGDAMLIL
jgi:S-adenosylmethionine:tRNA ribosyltransferase-isomerase